MRLLGKYAFDRLRDCLQGVFEYQKLESADGTKLYLIELWQIRIVITPHSSLEFYLNAGEQEGYISLGKVDLH